MASFFLQHRLSHSLSHPIAMPNLQHCLSHTIVYSMASSTLQDYLSHGISYPATSHIPSLARLLCSLLWKKRICCGHLLFGTIPVSPPCTHSPRQAALATFPSEAALLLDNTHQKASFQHPSSCALLCGFSHILYMFLRCLPLTRSHEAAKAQSPPYSHKQIQAQPFTQAWESQHSLGGKCGSGLMHLPLFLIQTPVADLNQPNKDRLTPCKCPPATWLQMHQRELNSYRTLEKQGGEIK